MLLRRTKLGNKGWNEEINLIIYSWSIVNEIIDKRLKCGNKN